MSPVGLVTELGTLDQSLVKLEEMLGTIAAYVDKVLDGSIPADNRIGRVLLNCIESIPRIDTASFTTMLNSSIQVRH